MQKALEMAVAQQARLEELNKLQQQRAAAAKAAAPSPDFWRVEGGAGVGGSGALSVDGERLVKLNAASKGKAAAHAAFDRTQRPESDF